MDDLIRRSDALAIFADAHPLDYNANAYRSGIEKILSVTSNKNLWKKFDDEWFEYYYNVETGEKKFNLEKGDILVDELGRLSIVT